MLKTIEENTFSNEEIKKLTISVNQNISTEEKNISKESIFKLIKAYRLIKQPNGKNYKLKDVAEALGVKKTYYSKGL